MCDAQPTEAVFAYVITAMTAHNINNFNSTSGALK
jgi:hypothetical protein